VKAELYWVQAVGAGRLAIMPHPRGGDWLEDEIRSLREDGVETLVSLLPTEEMIELALAEEPTLCAANGIDYISFPIVDRSVPHSRASLLSLLDQLCDLLHGGRGVAVHCRAGIGRSGLFVAAVLVREGIRPAEAIARVSAARGLETPDTAEQSEWVAASAPRRAGAWEQD